MKRIAWFCFVTLTLTGDTGTSIRPNASDYDAHQTIRDVTIGASILPAAEVSRLFSSAVRKKYIVVEIAVYPRNSRGFDVAAIEFALKTGPDDRTYAVTPEQVAWQGKRTPDPAPIQPPEKRTTEWPPTAASKWITGHSPVRRRSPVPTTAPTFSKVNCAALDFRRARRRGRFRVICISRRRSTGLRSLTSTIQGAANMP